MEALESFDERNGTGIGQRVLEEFFGQVME
jgi:hypothetical protein